MPRNLPSLTSLRWFAASAVFLVHSGYLLDNTRVAGVAHRICAQGPTGVSFFFILSGFVLAYSNSGGDSRGFYRKRFARIYPAYALVCLLTVAYLGTAFTVNRHGYVLDLFPLTLLQSWIPSQNVYFAGNGVSWSLSTEVFFYAMFPLIAPRLLRLNPRGLMTVAAASAFVSISFPLLLHPKGDSGLAFWAIYINPVFRLFEFVIGICLCGLILSGARLPISRLAGLAIGVAGYVAAGFVPKYAMWSAVTLIPFSLVIFANAQADVSGLPSRLHSRTLLRLGAWSYAFYLLHQLVIRIVTDEISWGDAPAMPIAMYAVTILAAWLLYRFVEHPLERRLRATRQPRVGDVAV